MGLRAFAYLKLNRLNCCCSGGKEQGCLSEYIVYVYMLYSLIIFSLSIKNVEELVDSADEPENESSEPQYKPIRHSPAVRDREG